MKFTDIIKRKGRPFLYALLMVQFNVSCNNTHKEIIKRECLKQFSSFQKNSLTREKIETLASIPTPFARFQIIDQKLYGQYYDAKQRLTALVQGRFELLAQNLTKTLKNFPIKNVEFIVFLADGLDQDKERNELLRTVPAFAMSKNNNHPGEKNLLLIPNEILGSHIWEKMIPQIKQASAKYTWDTKTDKVFWRGSTTGGMYYLENFGKLPRITLTMLSKCFPDLIDAKFANYVQFTNNESGKKLKEILLTLLGQAEWVKEVDHIAFKYCISLDGNGGPTWFRMPWIMLSNSVLIKHDTAMAELYYCALEPFVHYVPVNKNLSDLLEKIHWLKNNETAAKKISLSAQEFITSCLMPSDIQEYTALILNEYSTLQNFDLRQPTLPPFLG